MAQRFGISCIISITVATVLTACGVDSAVVVEDVDVDTQLEATNGLSVLGGQAQFDGGFSPRNVPFGGFGGKARCTPRKTPVIYFPGNGDDAKNFDFPASTGGPSVYAVFRDAGYSDCELFGVNWLSVESRKSPLKNFHDRPKAQIVGDFVQDVLAYTGAASVDVIGHSMGTTVALQGIERAGLWPKVRRFISISAAMRGLSSCSTFGYANPVAPVCGSQNVFSSDIFGLYPASLFVSNPRMGAGLTGFRYVPRRFSSTRFYAIGADIHDGFLCASTSFTAGCGTTALFEPTSNVISQLDVGHGSTALQLDYELTDYSIFKAGAGDVDGVGHFRAKNNTGRIQLNMLTTSCSGATCCEGYTAACGSASR